MSQQSRTQLIIGFIIFFLCINTMLALIPNPQYELRNKDMGHNVVYNYAYNIAGLGWWNTLIIIPFLAFIGYMIWGSFPGVNIGE